MPLVLLSRSRCKFFSIREKRAPFRAFERTRSRAGKTKACRKQGGKDAARTFRLAGRCNELAFCAFQSASSRRSFPFPCYENPPCGQAVLSGGTAIRLLSFGMRKSGKLLKHGKIHRSFKFFKKETLFLSSLSSRNAAARSSAKEIGVFGRGFSFFFGNRRYCIYG